MISYPSDFHYAVRDNAIDLQPRKDGESRWLVLMDQNGNGVYTMPIRKGEATELDDLRFEGRFVNFSLEDLPLTVATSVNFSRRGREDQFRLHHMINHLIKSGAPWTMRAVRDSFSVMPVTFILATACMKTYAEFYSIWPNHVKDDIEVNYETV